MVPWTNVMAMKVKMAQSCQTLCDAMIYTVHGILQARIVEWVAFPFSRGSSQPRDRTQVSYFAGRFSHPSTNQARPCLASEIRGDRARSGWYGRRLQADSLPAEPQGKPKNTGVRSLSFLQ